MEGGVIDAATSSSERSGNGEAQTAEMVHAAIDLAALACAAHLDTISAASRAACAIVADVRLRLASAGSARRSGDIIT